MTRADVFIEKYKELESLAVNNYNLPSDGRAVAYLGRMVQFRAVKKELSYCRDVRNLLQHGEKIGGNFAVEPSEDMVQMLIDVVEKVKNPLKCIDIAVLFKDMYWQTLDDPVYPAMQHMRRQGFAHTPILKGGHIIGVFSEKMVFSFLVDGDISHVNKEVKFKDIEKYLALDAHGSEVFEFIHKDATVAEAERACENAFRNRTRIGLFFITHSGKPSEKVLGLLTPWEVVGN